MSAKNANDVVELDSRNAPYVESLLEAYLQDSSSVPRVWQHYFRELASGNGETLTATRRPSLRPTSIFNPNKTRGSIRQLERSAQLFQHHVDQLVVAYRVHG